MNHNNFVTASTVLQYDYYVNIEVL